MHICKSSYKIFLVSIKTFDFSRGTQSMCSDYLRSASVGKVLPLLVRIFIVWVTIASLAGTYELVYEDVGIINMIKMLWSIKGNDCV